MTTPHTIYLVDDDEPVRLALHFALEAVGFTVESFKNAAELLSQILSQPSLLICDLRMPGLSGIELAKLLRAKGSTSPIILMTGHADDALKVKAVEAGADVVLEKPIALSALRAEIARLTSAHNL